MQPDVDVEKPDHWLRTATQQEKLDHVLKLVSKMPPKFRELFELTPASGIKPEPHVWRDLELESLPTGRVVLLGDAAHTMTPFRGEGGYHSFIDSMNLSKKLSQLDGKDINAVKTAVSEYNAEMLERGGEAVRSSRNENSDQRTRDTKANDGEPGGAAFARGADCVGGCEAAIETTWGGVTGVWSFFFFCVYDVTTTR